MVFPILGANTALVEDFVTNSLRINYTDAPKLVKTGTSAGSTTFTFSAWVKFAMSDTYNFVFCAGNQVGLAKDRAVSNNSQFYLNGATGGTYTNSDGYNRDPSAWYHLVVSCNSGTGIIYVNNDNRKGSINIPQLADDLAIGHFLRTEGVDTPQYDYYCDGYMAEVHFVDGSALNPSSFAETNDNGVWVPKDCKDDLTYGSNGFYLQFKETGTSANASGIGADTSGNDNHFTPTNLAAIDITTDTPQNNFATLNPITTATNDLSEGNTVSDLDNGTTNTSTTQFSANGKWYAEFKVTDLAGSNSYIRIGVVSAEQNAVDLGGQNETYAFLGDGRKYVEGSASSYGSALSVNDIVMVALDTDNNKVWYGANGTWFASGDPAGNSNESHAIDAGPAYGFAIASGTSSASPEIQCNFGNPAFSISSGNADANGYGNFEYAVPSGFYSLCTKNLAEFG